MNKAEILAEIATEVEAVGDVNLAGTPDSIANIRTYDVSVYYTINPENDLQKGTQIIYVKNEGDVTETAYRGRKRLKNYVAPVQEADGNAIIFSNLTGMVAAGGFSFMGTVDLASGTKAGLIELEYAGSVLKQVAITIIGGNVVTVPYKKV
jgi:hypothetical protein